MSDYYHPDTIEYIKKIRDLSMQRDVEKMVASSIGRIGRQFGTLDKLYRRNLGSIKQTFDWGPLRPSKQPIRGRKVFYGSQEVFDDSYLFAKQSSSKRVDPIKKKQWSGHDFPLSRNQTKTSFHESSWRTVDKTLDLYKPHLEELRTLFEDKIHPIIDIINNDILNKSMPEKDTKFWKTLKNRYSSMAEFLHTFTESSVEKKYLLHQADSISSYSKLDAKRFPWLSNIDNFRKEHAKLVAGISSSDTTLKPLIEQGLIGPLKAYFEQAPWAEGIFAGIEVPIKELIQRSRMDEIWDFRTEKTLKPHSMLMSGGAHPQFMLHVRRLFEKAGPTKMSDLDLLLDPTNYKGDYLHGDDFTSAKSKYDSKTEVLRSYKNLYDSINQIKHNLFISDDIPHGRIEFANLLDDYLEELIKLDDKIRDMGSKPYTTSDLHGLINNIDGISTMISVMNEEFGMSTNFPKDYFGYQRNIKTYKLDKNSPEFQEILRRDYEKYEAPGIRMILDDTNERLKRASRNYGEEITQGMVKGIMSEMNALMNAGSEIGRTVLEATADELDIKSPSKKFEFLGDQSAEGYINGLLKGIRENELNIKQAFSLILRGPLKKLNEQIQGQFKDTPYDVHIEQALAGMFKSFIDINNKIGRYDSHERINMLFESVRMTLENLSKVDFKQPIDKIVKDIKASGGEINAARYAVLFDSERQMAKTPPSYNIMSQKTALPIINDLVRQYQLLNTLTKDTKDVALTHSVKETLSYLMMLKEQFQSIKLTKDAIPKEPMEQFRNLSTIIAQMFNQLELFKTESGLDVLKDKLHSAKKEALELFLKIQELAGYSTEAHGELRTLADAMSSGGDKEASTSASSGVTSSSGGGSGWITFVQTLRRITAGAKQAYRSVSRVVHQIVRLVRSNRMIRQLSQGIQRGFQAISGFYIGSELQNVLKYSIKHVETLNLFRIATAGAREEAGKFISTLTQVYGFDPDTLMRSVGVFSQLANAIDMPAQAASKLSTGLTMAAVNVATLFGMQVDDVIQDFTSGMQGITRSVRKYGIDIRVSTLQTLADSLGMRGNVNNMTEANRQGLRYLAILHNIRAANNVFANTIESVANQLRVMKEQFKGLFREIGNMTMPFLEDLVYKINAVVMSTKDMITYFNMVKNFLPQTFETLGADKAADELEKAGQNTETLKKKLANLAGFDTLEILSDKRRNEDQMSEEISKAIEESELELQNFIMRAEQMRRDILAALGFTSESGKFIIEFDYTNNQWVEDVKWLGGVADKMKENFPIISSIVSGITSMFSNWVNHAEAFKNVFNELKLGLGELFSPIKDWIDEIFGPKTIDSFFTNLKENSRTFDFKDFVINFGSSLIASGLKLGAAALDVVGNFVDLISNAFENPKIVTKVGDAITQLGQSIMRNTGKLLLASLRIVTALLNYMKENMNTESIRTQVRDFVIDLKDTLVDFALELIPVGFKFISSVLFGMLEGLFTVNSVNDIIKLVQRLLSSILIFASDFTTVGMSLIRNLISGFIDGSVLSNIQNVVSMLVGYIIGMFAHLFIEMYTTLVSMWTHLLTNLIKYVMNPALIWDDAVSFFKDQIGAFKEGFEYGLYGSRDKEQAYDAWGNVWKDTGSSWLDVGQNVYDNLALAPRNPETYLSPESIRLLTEALKQQPVKVEVDVELDGRQLGQAIVDMEKYWDYALGGNP